MPQEHTILLFALTKLGLGGRLTNREVSSFPFILSSPDPGNGYVIKHSDPIFTAGVIFFESFSYVQCVIYADKKKRFHFLY